MGERGRKSAASLAVVVAHPGQHPEPPTELTDPQAAIWRAVVASKPAGWFEEGTHSLLASYCRHATAAQALARQLDACEAAADLDVGLYGELLRLRERETRALSALARSMRLTQQSRYTPQAAATAAGRVGPGRKPWEFEAPEP